jgi:hypothetical protein
MIFKRLCAALSGRGMWLRLKKKYGIDDGLYVLLMPEADRELNDRALRHIDDLIAHRRADGVVILTSDAWVKENAKTYFGKISAVIDCSPKAADMLISFYEFYPFSERLLIVSLTKPYGSKAWRTVGVHGVTKEDMVCLGVFRMRGWTRTEM